MQRLIGLPAALVLALALAFSACGGDDDETSPGGTTTATATRTGNAGSGTQDAEATATAEATPDDGDDGSDGEAAETPVGASGDNPCDLISADEINDITSGGFDEGQQTPDSCAFTTSGGDTIGVIVQNFPGQAEVKFEHIFDGDLLGYEEIGGAGERAAWTNDYNELEILAGDDLVVINIYYTAGDDDAVAQDQAFEIAAVVLGRLA
jgi:hypothetical protein